MSLSSNSLSPEDAGLLESVLYSNHEAILSWLGTSASQIFFMQLGFLCYEVGYVQAVWSPSIILKNIEDTFVGMLTYLAISNTFATSSPSLYGIISVPNELFLINVDASKHAEVFIAAVFATTCATIISGCVLERMKNKAYILYCFLIILLNYSFVAHWVWNPEGWLAKLGFMDGAGACVIHATGGIAGAIAVWQLGPRRGSLEKDGVLKEPEPARNPTMVAIGAFILWYGWFAFNISSPVAAGLGIGDALATTGLVTAIAPTCSCCSAMLLMYWGFAKLSYDNLLGALLSGLVSITGTCYTCNVWEGAVIGFFASFVYFLAIHAVRYKLKLDDPLQIIAVHACCGAYSCVMEGVFAYDVVGYPGLIYGGYKHFGVQLLGTTAIVLFNIACCYFIYMVLMQRCCCRNTEIRVSVLDTYLGVSIFALSNTMALEEVLENTTNLAKQMSFRFHNYSVGRFNDEQFDFLIAIHVFRDYVLFHNDPTKTAKAAISIIDTYVAPESEMCANVSGTQRSQLLRLRDRVKHELNGDREPEIDGNDHSYGHHSRRTSRISRHKAVPSSIFDGDLLSETLFDNAHGEVFRIVLPVFAQFLQRFHPKQDTIKESVRLPFVLRPDWSLEWDEELVKQTARERVGSLCEAATPECSEMDFDAVLLTSVNNQIIQVQEEVELVNPMQAQLSTDDGAVATANDAENGQNGHASNVSVVLHDEQA